MHLKWVRNILSKYISTHPQFRTSLVPLDPHDEDPELIVEMKIAARSARTGPMASVAGLVAAEIGKCLIDYGYNGEFVIENGGDICLQINDVIVLGIETGANQYFRNLGLKIFPRETAFGVCTSSGTMGHSYSMGKSDAVTVIANNVALADAWATSIGNRIINKKDLNDANFDFADEEIDAVVAIKDDQFGIRGRVEIVPLA